MASVQTSAHNYTVERYEADHQNCCTENVLHSRIMFGACEVCVCVFIRFLTEKVSPDVARLCVDSEDALEARSEGRHRWPVSVQEKVVVLQPIRQHVMRDDTPPAFPHLHRTER